MRLSIKNQLTTNQGKQKTLPATTSIIPTYSYNQKNYEKTNSKISSLQIWRKTSFPVSSTKHTNVRITDILKPNGTIYQGFDASGCSQIKQNSIVIETPKENTQAASNVVCSYDQSNNKMLRCGANPTNIVTSTATTILSKNYCQTAKMYQHSRCINLDQRRSFVHNANSTNTNLYNMTKCQTNCTTTFKPRNPTFNCNNSVTSSTRTARIQHQTLTRENVDFKTTYGIQHNSNYIPSINSLRNIKSITENQCNNANRSLTKLRHAYRPTFGMKCCICSTA